MEVQLPQPNGRHAAMLPSLPPAGEGTCLTCSDRSGEHCRYSAEVALHTDCDSPLPTKTSILSQKVSSIRITSHLSEWRWLYAGGCF